MNVIGMVRISFSKLKTCHFLTWLKNPPPSAHDIQVELILVPHNYIIIGWSLNGPHAL
jgi:hypothetical protein